MSESISSLVRIKLHFIETTLWSSMLIHSFGMFMWQTAAVWLHLCSLRFKIHRRPLLIWESRFLLFLVPHPFLAVCGKSFTLCPIRSTFSWQIEGFSFHQGLRRKQPLYTFSISCFILFIICFLLGRGDSGEIQLRFPWRRKGQEEYLQERGEKSKTLRVQPSQPSAVSLFDTHFWQPLLCCILEYKGYGVPSVSYLRCSVLADG